MAINILGAAQLKSQPSSSEPGAYISVEQLLQLRHLAKGLTIDTRKKSKAMSDGDSHTHFRGRGMEFSEVRPYQPGDDIRNIDWRVTARTQQTYTKLFQEERERPVFIVVDQRSHLFFGSQQVFKSVFAAQLASVIAWIAVQNNDRIGALVIGDYEQTDLRARRGKHAALALINQIHQYNQKLSSPILPSVNHQHSPIEMKDILSDLRRVAKPGSAIFVLSDFHDFTESCRESFSMLARHTDVSLVKVFDPLEYALPAHAQLSISNGTDRMTVGTDTRNFLEDYSNAFKGTQSMLSRCCINAGAALLNVDISSSIAQHTQDIFANSSRGGGQR